MKTNWKYEICLAISVIGTLFLVIGLFWLIVAKAQSQIAELSDKLPGMVENAKAQLTKYTMDWKSIGLKAID